ncbi:MAG: hypothetical protein AUG79_02140 [Gemmatimonadetes bacterium 13_1_20CM_4_69_16]|nr:MAG: hypothetical protein AUG79_02140 [Gemmatimonadetes bacterium 13_1_20CM_4_69_16]
MRRAPLQAGAPIRLDRLAVPPPVRPETAIYTRAPVVQQAAVAERAAVGERFVAPGLASMQSASGPNLPASVEPG